MAIALRGSTWDPFSALVRQFDADFDVVARRAFGPRQRVEATSFVPAVNVAKDGTDVVLTVELPGVDPEQDVDVEVTQGRLVISGRRAERHSSDSEGVLVRQIRTGAFRREFGLPKGVTAEQVTADYDRGLLTVRVRDVTAAPVEPAKIKVEIGSGKPAVEVAGEPTEGHAETQTTEGTD